MNNYVKSGYTSVIELGFMDLTEIDKIVCPRAFFPKNNRDEGNLTVF